MRGKNKIKIRHLALLIGLILGASAPQQIVRAVSCPDVRLVFARGSGGELYNDQNYLEFKSTIETKLHSMSLSYEFIDLDYPAVAIGLDHLGVTVGAALGTGDAYEFGASIDDGVARLHQMINGAACPSTEYVIGGYSQGAMVVSKALDGLNANQLIYAATFGDPKIYLPEGRGIMPVACTGGELSDYRMYVPDCQAYKGLLGAYIPYEPETLVGKVGTWCNKRDLFCSSSFSVSDHTAYVSENLYEDASRVIFDKIAKHFGIENKITSPHDTAILIDSTGSMSDMIDRYKAEALRLATETLDSGGRVALYDYRDLADPYTPVGHCNFETCTLEVFKNELDTIEINGGGDDKESLLSASFKVMTDLEWHYGSTKSLVVLTDDGFLSPDRDGITFDEVVALSKSIDPVNFYIITDQGGIYESLAEATDGKVVTNFNELSLLTDYIMERYDSLPRVEEREKLAQIPSITVKGVTQNDSGQVVIDFEETGGRVLVALNGYILGVVDGKSVVIEGVDLQAENTFTLASVSKGYRGEPVEVKLDGYGGSEDKGETEAGTETDSDTGDDSVPEADSTSTPTVTILESSESIVNLPKAPNTGKR